MIIATMFKDIIKLLRIKQWYKNILVFLPIFFSGALLTTNLTKYILAFIALCLISSSNYIINDIKDIKEDRYHFEKKRRPIASGKISVQKAIIIYLFLLILGMFISINVGFPFTVLVISLMISTNAYIFWLKQIAFLDIIVISINFLIRTISGAYVESNNFLPKIPLSSWLILSVFFLAIFLTSSKREADIRYLKSDAEKHKQTLKYYNFETIMFITNISVTMLITVYTLYLIFVKNAFYLITLPISLFALIRYVYLLKTNNIITRHPELMYKDKELISSILLWVIIMSILIYVI